MRARTRVLVSLGDCAVTGNVTALRNLVPLDRVLRTAYVERATVASGVPSRRARPRAASAAARHEPLHRVVPVDAYLPGCPPSADRIWEALLALLEGRSLGGDGARAPRFG